MIRCRNKVDVQSSVANIGTQMEFSKQSKELRKSNKEYRKQHVLSTIDKDLDLRDRCLGIRALKTKFNPIPYHNNNNNNNKGEHVKYKDRAQAAAEHLSNKQWGKSTTEEEEQRQITNWNTDKIVTEQAAYDTQAQSRLEEKSKQ